jgi:ComF family protein
MIDRLLSVFAPHPCCGCGNVGSLLCPQCKYDIVSEPYSQCVICERPTSVAALCADCQSSSVFEAMWCTGARTGALQSLIDRYKFDSAREAARHAAELLDSVVPVLPQETVIVPVPTSPAHQRSRGFDHTALIAREFARLRRLPYCRVLERHGSETQHFLSRQARTQVAAQLRLTGPVPATVLLLDDIYTTGATMTACGQILRGGGCEALCGAIIARQTLDETAYL